MAHQVIATRPATFRACYRINGLTIVVMDETELVQDSDYAEGVMGALQESWDARDYFYVASVNDAGETIDSCGGMAGYGGPRQAAEAFVGDYCAPSVPTSERRESSLHPSVKARLDELTPGELREIVGSILEIMYTPSDDGDNVDWSSDTPMYIDQVLSARGLVAT